MKNIKLTKRGWFFNSKYDFSAQMCPKDVIKDTKIAKYQ